MLYVKSGTYYSRNRKKILKRIREYNLRYKNKISLARKLKRKEDYKQDLVLWIEEHTNKHPNGQ